MTDDADVAVEEEEDFGGLMVWIHHQSHGVILNVFLVCDKSHVKGKEGQKESEEGCS